jgi:hypothetical protein
MLVQSYRIGHLTSDGLMKHCERKKYGDPNHTSNILQPFKKVFNFTVT